MVGSQGEKHVASEDSGRLFDQRMHSYMRSLREQALSRRGLSEGFWWTGRCSATAGVLPFVAPGVSVLAQDDDTVTMGLESDLRGVEPALGYDFTANPVICNITEGLMALDDKQRNVSAAGREIRQSRCANIHLQPCAPTSLPRWHDHDGRRCDRLDWPGPGGGNRLTDGLDV